MELRSVLLVDDDPDIRHIARLSLERVGGFNVEVASSGREGLSLAVESRPDLILLDVMMPGMDGPATLERLRASADTAGIPVVFMTAKVQVQEIESWLAMGAAAVIPKPFDPMGLPGELRRIAASIP